jgi:hypothetical protein
MTSQCTATGLTLAEAAEVLGISPTAVRGRVRRGTVSATLVGGRWYVDLAGRPGNGQVAGQPTSQPRDQQNDHGGVALIARLETDVAYLQAALEREQLASAELRRLLAAEQQRRLPAPVDIVATQPETAENRPAPADSTQTPPRPWWRFWVCA